MDGLPVRRNDQFAGRYVGTGPFPTGRARGPQVHILYLFDRGAGRYPWIMPGYQQFCPVALAAEILARRWTPLVLRELLLGSVRFNEIHRGVPQMSRTLLSKRLDELERAQLLRRREVEGHPEYHLTRAGEELEGLVIEMGAWGKRWLRADLRDEDLDVRYLMWDMQRRIVREALPPRQVVVHFHFTDADDDLRNFWLVLEPEEVELCLKDPGYGADLRAVSSVRTMVEVWLGDRDLDRALREEKIRLRGPRELRRRFPDWLGLSLLAGIDRAR